MPKRVWWPVAAIVVCCLIGAVRDGPRPTVVDTDGPQFRAWLESQTSEP